ncbi:PREDICTED: mediator of RNA polymerase II transcription subunit 26-like [Papilio polytes]|uniref:mediator of RNA polymerase II transcription subunit 26-like n=1 Tax=Papilio polytes TaxID=76194 RepID=UPI00067608BD|nr:PREDICTED: mediator of RNA polymerase II transcription subunit 26-like [Papilio polytes]
MCFVSRLTLVRRGSSAGGVAVTLTVAYAFVNPNKIVTIFISIYSLLMVQLQVVDMHAVNEIISILEKINITKELLETTRLGKHVNELRRKTTDQTLARRAKVLVKRWRDLVIPTVASPAHTGSNRSSAERQMRRLGGTPLTSPALTRNVVSPAVPSPRTQARPAWGGYESDSQDVILVDDEPPAALPPPPITPLAPLAPLATQKPLTPTPTITPTPPIKRQPSPESVHDDKKAKRDKKPKKRRGHSRAGSGAEAGGVVESALAH